jgi:hypothetical protein
MSRQTFDTHTRSGALEHGAGSCPLCAVSTRSKGATESRKAQMDGVGDDGGDDDEEEEDDDEEE